MRNPNQPTDIEDREKSVVVPFANIYTQATWVPEDYGVNDVKRGVTVYANSVTEHKFDDWEHDFHSPRVCPAGMYAVIEVSHLNLNFAIPFTDQLISPELDRFDLKSYNLGALLLDPLTDITLSLNQLVKYPNKENLDFDVDQDLHLKGSSIKIRLKEQQTDESMITKDACRYQFDGGHFLEFFRDKANHNCIDAHLKHDRYFRFTLGRMMDFLRPYYDLVPQLYHTKTTGSKTFWFTLVDEVPADHLAAIFKAIKDVNMHMVTNVRTVDLQTHVDLNDHTKEFKLRLEWKPK